MLGSELNKVKICWTDNDVPHIEAQDYQSLGFGYGYVHARDRLAELCAQAIALRGERSKYYGAEQRSTIGFLQTTNLNSDLMCRLRIPTDWVKSELNHLSDNTSDYVLGYVRGLNYFVQSLTESEWLERNKIEPIITFEPEDVVRSAMRFGIMKELIEIGPHLVDSSGAWRADFSLDGESCHRKDIVIEGGFGSNAWAFGCDVVAGEGAILLGNPHSAWQRTPHQQRIYMHQYHLTIPGELDVAGTSFLGFPLPMTGYNADVSWSILDAATVTPYVLQYMSVDESDLTPTYVVDGQKKPLEVRSINLEVLEESGEINVRRYQFLHSSLGTLYKLPERPGKPEGWYAITNPGENNARGLNQFLEAAKAGSTREFVQAIESNRGILCQLVIADKYGEVGYVVAGNVPPIADGAMKECHFGDDTVAFNVLDGTRSQCSLRDKEHRPQLAPKSFYPNIISRGIIQNTNNSYKYTEYGVCQPDFPSVFGQHKPECQISKPIAAGLKYDPRLVMSTLRIEELCRSSALTSDNILQLLFDNRNYAAETFLPKIVSKLSMSSSSLVQEALEVFRLWDKKNNAKSRGALLFHVFWSKVVQLNVISVPSCGDPTLGTQLDLSPESISKIEEMLKVSIDELRTLGFELNQAWGEVLSQTVKGRKIPLHGGSYQEGILNGEMPAPLEKNGFPYILFGTAYVQLTQWIDGQIFVKGLLSHGQRDGVDSEGRVKQLNMFSNKELGVIPFLPNQIRNATHVKTLILDTTP